MTWEHRFDIDQSVAEWRLVEDLLVISMVKFETNIQNRTLSYLVSDFKRPKMDEAFGTHGTGMAKQKRRTRDEGPQYHVPRVCYVSIMRILARKWPSIRLARRLKEMM